MYSVSRDCDLCGRYVTVEISTNERVSCPFCSKSWGAIDEKTAFEICPFCQCKQFYVQKDFNRALGCLVMLIGILLVPITYGLSLPVFSAIDWFLYRRVQTMVVCYRCGAEFKGFAIPSHFKNFMHHIGEKYEREEKKKEG